MIRIPATLRESCADGAREPWLARLPGVVAELTLRWSLDVLDPFEPGGHCAWVAPARRSSGEDVVLKVGWRHPEADDEAAGLAFWAGDGAVRLLESTTVGDSSALVLERCVPGRALEQVSAPEDRDVVVAQLLKRLWREPPPGHEFRALQQMCDEWADGAQAGLAGASAPDPGVIRAGIAMFRDLPTSADREVVLLTDLHADNVLSAEREPWLAIDPKPYVGDPTYDVVQHMLNEPRVASDPDGLVRRMADLAELEGARLRLWLFARCAIMAVEDPAFTDVAARLAP